MRFRIRREAASDQFLLTKLGELCRLLGILHVRAGEWPASRIISKWYAGGRRQGNLRAADAEVRAAMANAQSILDAVSLEVTLAYRAAATSQRRIGRLRPAVTEARENPRLVRNRYRNGNATPTDIVDAETTLTGAQQKLSSARYEFLVALVRLDYALASEEGSLLCAAPDPLETLPSPRKVAD